MKKRPRPNPPPPAGAQPQEAPVPAHEVSPATPSAENAGAVKVKVSLKGGVKVPKQRKPRSKPKSDGGSENPKKSKRSGGSKYREEEEEQEDQEEDETMGDDDEDLDENYDGGNGASSPKRRKRRKSIRQAAHVQAPAAPLEGSPAPVGRPKRSLDSDPVYCICRSKDDGRFMIACDSCEEWFHGDCVGVSKYAAKKVGSYTCPRCKEKQDKERKVKATERDERIQKRQQNKEMPMGILEASIREQHGIPPGTVLEAQGAIPKVESETAPPAGAPEATVLATNVAAASKKKRAPKKTAKPANKSTDAKPSGTPAEQEAAHSTAFGDANTPPAKRPKITPSLPPPPPPPAGACWSGFISKAGYPPFTVAGFHLTGNIESIKELPSSLNVSGRLEIKRLNEYLHQLSTSVSRHRTVMRLEPQGAKDTTVYQDVFKYFIGRDRAGFVQPDKDKDKQSKIEEIYVIPLRHSDPYPEFLAQDPTFTNPTARSDCLIIAVVARIVREGVPAGSQVKSETAAPSSTAPATPTGGVQDNFLQGASNRFTSKV